MSELTTSDINECPHCGYKFVALAVNDEGQHAVVCLNCRLIGPIRDGKMEAVAAWNADAQAAAFDAAKEAQS